MRSTLLLALFLTLAAGCGQRSATREYPVPSPNVSAEATLPDLGVTVERANPTLVNRTSYFVAHRDRLKKLCSPAMEALAKDPDPPFAEAYRPVGPGVTSPGRVGWRAIGRALVFRIEDSVEAKRAGLTGDHGKTIATYLTATRLGFALTGGDAVDATMGYTIVDEARDAMVRALPDLTRDELVRLSRGLRLAVTKWPKMEVTARHEADAALLGVAWLQRNQHDVKALTNEMGTDGATLAKYLKEPENGYAFFEGLAEETGKEATAMVHLADVPVTKRPQDPMEGADKKRPWRRAARHLGRALRPVLAMRDVTLARTRLLMLEVEIRRMVREGARPPSTLKAFSEGARRDPFTGETFLYRAEGSEFLIWSVGEDGRDDGGLSDEGGRTPDLILDPRL